jgi:subtilisin family serine protease
MPIRIGYGRYQDGERDWVTCDSWIERGIRYAADNGARILSNSWGGETPSTSITEAIRYARNEKRCVVIVAAGNDGEPSVDYPARLSEVIAVGASSPCDERKDLSSCDREPWGSNYGPELDVIAPGVLITTTDISAARGYNAASGNYTSTFNGTSAAAPHVAGLAALILSANPSLTPDQVQRIIQDTADDLGSPGRDDETGYGRVNAYRAVLRAKLGR